MLNQLLKMLQYIKLKNSNEDHSKEIKKKIDHVPKSTKEVKNRLNEMFTECNDFVIREIIIGEEKQIKILIAFLNGMIDKEMVNDSIMKPMLSSVSLSKEEHDIHSSKVVSIIKEKVLSSCQVNEVKDFRKSIEAILSGETIIYIDGCKIALSIDTQGYPLRNVEPPQGEKVIRGPHEGFVESVNVNISLMRRKIKNPKLKFELVQLGEQTKTDVYIAYIKGIVNDDIVDAVKRRLKRINTDAILESRYVEAFIEDAPLSFFPTVGSTERPDTVAGKILEGRVAILCDGTPCVLTVPYLFVESLQTSADYYSRWYYSSLIRILTIVGLVMSVTLPAFYIAFVGFHQDVIPYKLLLTITASREGMPLSPLVEAMFMGLVFELLIEAGVRMPGPIGQTISIVGALVLGDAVVKAGLVSTPMIIISALTAISSFIVPGLREAMPFFRILMIIVANILGFMGMMLTAIFLVLHMCTLRSFGVPYLAPFAPLNGMDLKDTFIKVPLWDMVTRPRVLTWENTDKTRYKMKIDFRKKED